MSAERANFMEVDQSLTRMRNISQPKSSGAPRILRQLASHTWNFFTGLDQESAVTVEQSLIFCLIALAIWVLAPFWCLVTTGTCSSILAPRSEEHTSELQSPMY